MVRAFESEKWAVPSGGIEEGETPEECCIREVKEETGYEVQIINKMFVKKIIIKGFEIKTHYFIVKIVKDADGFNDPDKIIAEVGWKSISELLKISHAYPEDLERLLDVIERF